MNSFDRLSETYSPSTTKSRPDRTSSRDRSRGRSKDSSNGDRPESRDCFRGVGESYDNSHSSYRTGINHGYRYRDRDRSRHAKRGRDSESILSRVSKSGFSDGGYWKSKSKRHKPTDEDDLTMPWMCEEKDPFTPRIRNFKSSRAVRVWFDELPSESIYSYKNLKETFLAYFMQQKKYVKDPVEIHNIKQKDGETIKDFMKRFKMKTGRIREPLNTMKEIMITTTVFTRGEAIAASKKKGRTSWRTHGQSKRHTSEKRYNFRGQPREGMGSSRFTPLTRTPKEILATEAGKFQPPPPMLTPVEKRSNNKFCDFHNDKGHSTDECMQLKKQIEEKITFPSLATSSGTEGPLVIEAKIDGHMIHRMYVDGGSLTEVLYEHCFNRLRPEVKNQMVPATTSLTGFSGETIWPLGQLRLLVTIEDVDHSTRAWMNFIIVRSLSPYNGIIRRPGIKEIQAVPSTAHGMLKFPADGGIVTIHSTILIPAECATVITSSKEIPKEAGVRHENFKVALHPNLPDLEVAIEETLSAKGRTELCSLLKENLDIFAWQLSDMTGVPPSVAEHRLNIREGYSPRLVDKAFDSQIGRNIEVYIKDLNIKRHTEAEILRDIGETFCTLRKINMKLNPKKCTFGAVEGMFLGYMITPEGIKPCPDKTEAVLQLLSPRTIKKVKSLNGKLASLNRFLSKSAEKSPQEASETLITDGSSCVDGSGTGLILTSPEGTDFTYALRFQFAASNNEAEYEALIAGLRIAAQIGVQNVYVSVDSKLVANQVLGAYVTKEENMIKYLGKVKILICTLIQIALGRNTQRKIHTREGGDNRGRGRWTNVDDTNNRIFERRTLPGDRNEARKLRIKARQYELLEGVLYRSMHAGPRSVVAKAIRLGYYWPTMHQDAQDMIREIVSDNGKQFSDNSFKDWCEKLNITQRFPSVKHPQSNGLVERANQSLREGIKARLGEGNKNWVEGLPHVLWAHRTMIKSSHGDTPFSLTYGTEAIIPAEIGMPTYRTTVVDVIYNDEELRLNLDLLEERYERAAIREAKSKLKMTKYYNARVRGVTFRPGDFVYRSNNASHAVDRGKLGPKWEGPYEVTEAFGDGAYKLRSANGTILPRI
uniref:Integrase catalytic domain-containing protein n=1 Tax=Tanacetum cinerariifolium TaxID=118510 RepID=A0A6L2KS77_TANCI|nr:hypothetical protein [Tanacetum cinerariifolium]